MKRLKRGIIVCSVILLTLFMFASCSFTKDASDTALERSKDYTHYTEMLGKFPLGSDYNDITAYLDEEKLYYTTATDNLPRIQVFGGHLIFNADNELVSVFSTAWQHPDGWGTGSALDEVEAIYGKGSKLNDTQETTYIFKGKDGKTLITVVFDKHCVAEQWAIS